MCVMPKYVERSQWNLALMLRHASIWCSLGVHVCVFVRMYPCAASCTHVCGCESLRGYPEPTPALMKQQKTRICYYSKTQHYS